VTCRRRFAGSVVILALALSACSSHSATHSAAPPSEPNSRASTPSTTYPVLPGPSFDSGGGQLCAPPRPIAGSESGANPDLGAVERRWPKHVPALKHGAAQVHYEDLWRATTPGVTEADVFTIGVEPVDVLFLGRPGGYTTADVQRLRQNLINACFALSHGTDIYRGAHGAFGSAGRFAFAAHGVAVFVFFGELDETKSEMVMSALQG
jgi:hypothetical protein